MSESTEGKFGEQ